jgi:ABC-type Mn2+/Zn2+ transport system permease subunit
MISKAVLAVITGLGLSLQWDLPTGPAFVVAAALLLTISRVWQRSDS